MKKLTGRFLPLFIAAAVILFPIAALAESFNPDSGCTIPTSLVVYYDCDESSGNLLDSKGSNDQTDTNTVASATGIVSNARDFERDNSEYFTRADTADLSSGDISFTITAWVKIETKSGAGSQMWIFNKGNGTDREYMLLYDVDSDRFRFFISVDGLGSAYAIVNADNFGAVSAATWYWIQAGYDTSADVTFISVNNGTENTTATLGLGPTDLTGGSAVGNQVAAADYWDGLIDEIAFHKKRLATAEKADLYNAGAGNTYDPTGSCGSQVIVVARGYGCGEAWMRDEEMELAA